MKKMLLCGILILLFITAKGICENNSYNTISIGDTIFFGHYEQDNILENGTEPVEWIVLQKNDGKIMVVSKYVLDYQPYDSDEMGEGWKDSTIRKWLNDTFYNNAFSSNEATLIENTTIKNDFQEQPQKKKWTPLVSDDTNDKIFLLSIREYYNYLYGRFETTSTKYAHKKGSKGLLWGKNVSQYTRSSGRKGNQVAYLYLGTDPNDDALSCSKSLKDGIRPAVWINISKEHEKTDFELYEEARKEQEAGHFEQAALIYEQLENYNNCESLAKICRYNQAIYAYENGDYEKSIEIFETLGDYEDCYALARESRYKYAESCYLSENYKLAAELYDTVGQYKDSMNKLIDCFEQLKVPIHYFANNNICWYDTGKDNGYSGEGKEKKGLHKRWTLGQFFITDYMRVDNQFSDHPVFIKSLGNAVTLRFYLMQDIDRLNGDDSLSICSDTNDYDKKLMKDDYSESFTFGRGTLLIRHTNRQNKSRLIPYADYLLAKGTTGANTKVVLEEEGEYEVALDYEVRKKKRLINEYGNYSIRFNFEIRNDDMAVHFIDVTNSSELFDRSVTKGGFRISILSSNALEPRVQYFTIINDGTEYGALNQNYDRPSRDGNEYNREGIYIITTTDSRTNESISKTIFVGDYEIRTRYDKIKNETGR